MASKRKILLYIGITVLTALVLLFLYTFREKIGKIITPFLIAVVIAYLLNPAIKSLENRKIPRKVGILIIYLGFAVFTVSMTVFIVPELINNAKELMNTLPDIISRYQNMFNSLISSVQSSRWSGDIKNIIYNEMQNAGEIAETAVTNTIKGSLAALVDVVKMLLDVLLAMVIAYYLIKDAEFFKSSTLALTPRRWRNGIINIGREVNLVLSNFIQGQLLTAFIVGVLEMIGLTIVKVKYPLVLGLIGGVAEIIPYFGPVIGAVPAVAVALLESPVKVVWVVLVFVIVQQLENNLISPKIIQGKLGLHPVTTILAILAGGEFFGIIGMLAAVPAAAILKVLVKRAVDAIA